MDSNGALTNRGALTNSVSKPSARPLARTLLSLTFML